MTTSPTGPADTAGRDAAPRRDQRPGTPDAGPASSRNRLVRRVPLPTSGPVARVLQVGLVVLPYLAAAALALVAALWTYQPWKFGSAIANPSGDNLAFHAWIQNIVETGWYETGERLAAPFAQNSHSYSVTDDLLFAFVGKVLVPLTGSVGAAVTAVVVLSFPLAAVTAVGLARSLRVGRVPAVLVGVAFAVLPDHFLRGTGGHIALAQTWVLPIGVVAAVTLVHRSPWRGRRLRLREAAVVVGLLSIGLVNAYYAVFVGILVAAAALGGWRLRGFRAVLVPTVVRVVALALPVGVTMWLDARWTPSPLGFASMAVTRSPADADIYGGKILAMLLPGSGHRVPALRALRQQYDATFPNPAEGPALGVVAAAGFLFLIVWSVVTLWSRAGSRRRPVLQTLAALTWVSLLAYTVGGIGQLWSFALDGGGLRAWSRMHVVIALLALLAVGTLLGRLRRRPLVQTGVVAALVAVALLDQTSGIYRPDPGTAKAVQAEVTDLTGRLEGLLPSGAMVYQYPDVSFPVALRTTGPASAYDGFLPYLYSSEDLRWSYGGLQGDPTADWQQALGQRPPAQQRELLTAAGFAAVLVDTATASSTPEDLAAMRAALGAPAVVSTSGRWEAYLLDEDRAACAADRTALADAALHPPLLYPGDGFGPIGNTIQGADGGELRVLTLQDGGWPRADLAFTLEAPAGGARVTWPDGSATDVAPGAHQVGWTGPLDGAETRIGVEVSGGDPTGVRAYGFTADVLDADADACLASAEAVPAAAP
ncbi:hypothetical protein [Cellulomonas sp. PS-H5]|uniref:hypothetical protein n=1 Tax=Cellulomonas sp. PS-H5 TaxID=2820400 RepID=UPI001C4ED3BA|nr:hypothetical protein [Cellulomonas sp. PS-H5]MBW0254630.1 hypothetical protein [Cellulomonas sp. PS-H5]